MRRHRPSSQDPVLVAAVTLVAAAVAWFLVGTTPPLTAARVAWGLCVLGTAGVVVTCCQLALRRPPADPRRTPWLWLAAGGFAGMSGFVLQLLLGRSDTDLVFRLPVVGLFGVAALAAILSVLTHPLPPLSRAASIRMHLEAGAIVVAGGVADWYLRSVGGRGRFEGNWAALVEPFIVMGATYGLARIALTGGGRPRVAGLLWPLAYVLSAGASTRAESWIAAGHSAWFFSLSLIAVAMMFVSVRLIATRRVAAGEHPRREDIRQRSPLAYSALAVIFVICAAAAMGTAGRGPSGLIPVGGAAIATVFVVLRHRSAFSENELLLSQITQVLGERDDLAGMLERMAFEDPLTGVANRARFTEHLRAAQVEAARRGISVALLLIDLDDFKPVNDRYGHAAGDLVLRECAIRMSACLGPDALLARIGGDEFAVVLRQSYKLGATALAERLVAEVGRPIPLGAGLTAQIGASIGIAADTGGRRTPDALMHDADLAMYDAKDRGKGTVSIG